LLETIELPNFALVTTLTSKEGGGHYYKESIFGNRGDLSTAALLYRSSRGKINSLVKWQGRWCLLM
jgi:hypothetical protein